jgi:hypothetical protein
MRIKRSGKPRTDADKLLTRSYHVRQSLKQSFLERVTIRHRPGAPFRLAIRRVLTIVALLMSATICLCCGGKLNIPDSSNPNLCLDCAQELVMEQPRTFVRASIPISLPEPVVELTGALN